MKHKFASWLVIGTGLLIATSQRCSVLSAQDQQSADRSLDAQKWLNDGVEAFKRAQNDEAIEDFKKAKELDPSLTKARLFLATAYASQYIPGAPSAENIRYGEQAVREYTEILETDPNNLSAIDGIGSILYQMARTPLNVDKMDESKSYHKKHTQLAPDSPTQWYWIGIIDWEIAFRANKELRAEWMKKTSRDLQPSDALPEEAQQKFILKYSDTVQEGIASLEKAIVLNPEYDDAMAYLNLLYRQKADMELNSSSRQDDLKKADELVDQVKAIQQKKMEQRQTPQ